MPQADIYAYDQTLLQFAALRGVALPDGGRALAVALVGRNASGGLVFIRVGDDGIISTSPIAFTEVVYTNVPLGASGSGSAEYLSPVLSGSDWTRLTGIVGSNRAGEMWIEQCHSDAFPAGRYTITKYEYVPAEHTMNGGLMRFDQQRCAPYVRLRFLNTESSAQSWFELSASKTTVVR